MQAKTYVCGDIHGNFKALKEVLHKADFDPDRDTLITIGDYIDGGEHMEVLELMEYLLQLPSWIGIIGNHDYWMMETIDAGWKYVVDTRWLQYGGRNTLKCMGISYDVDANGTYLLDPCPPVVRTFFKRLQYYHVDERNYLYVHAGYDHTLGRVDTHDFEDADVIHNTIKQRDFWKNAENLDPLHYDKVYLGHTWNKDFPELRGKVWNIDSGAGFLDRLTLMDVSTDEFIRSSRVPELYPNYTTR